MTDILAGTAFGQVFGLRLGVPKPKQKTIKYGLMKKEKITSIKVSESHDNQLFYASQKNVYAGWNENQSQTTVFSNKYNNSKIIGIQPYLDNILIALNNGSLISATINQQSSDWTDQEILAPKFQSTLNKCYNKLIFDSQNSFCFIGKQVLPFLFNFDKNVITWNGKNVPNDELDLRVPINDVDATFFKNKACMACANNDSKVRVYDVRTNKQKPSADYHLKLQKVYTKMNLTRIIVSPENQNTFYIANDLGGVYEMDIRKQMGMVGKFKGINSTVTDLAIYGEDLYVSSLDSYVRSFSLESREMSEKFYMNKPIYSIYIKQKQGGDEDNEFEEEALSEQQEEEVNKKEIQQMKKLRKRNKVNLKYLKPVNWDQVPIKEQLLQQAKEQYEQINSKDADSYLDQQQEEYIVKDEHNSDEEIDSDLD